VLSKACLHGVVLRLLGVYIPDNVLLASQLLFVLLQFGLGLAIFIDQIHVDPAQSRDLGHFTTFNFFVELLKSEGFLHFVLVTEVEVFEFSKYGVILDI
jgi:hypothetical protein